MRYVAKTEFQVGGRTVSEGAVLTAQPVAETLMGETLHKLSDSEGHGAGWVIDRGVEISVFWLDPGSGYDRFVELTQPECGLLGRVEDEGG